MLDVVISCIKFASQVSCPSIKVNIKLTCSVYFVAMGSKRLTIQHLVEQRGACVGSIIRGDEVNLRSYPGRPGHPRKPISLPRSPIYRSRIAAIRKACTADSAYDFLSWRNFPRMKSPTASKSSATAPHYTSHNGEVPPTNVRP